MVCQLLTTRIYTVFLENRTRKPTVNSQENWGDKNQETKIENERNRRSDPRNTSKTVDQKSKHVRIITVAFKNNRQKPRFHNLHNS